MSERDYAAFFIDRRYAGGRTVLLTAATAGRRRTSVLPPGESLASLDAAGGNPGGAHRPSIGQIAH